MVKNTRQPNVDVMTKRRIQNERDETQQEKAQEVSRLMQRLGLMMDRLRMFDRWVIRLRRKSDMFPVWVRRGRNADTLLNEMLRWLRTKAKNIKEDKQ